MIDHQCAWCRKPLPAEPAGQSADYTGNAVSHGICSDCLQFLKTNSPGRKLSQLLDTITQPVLVVDADGTVRMANRPAKEMLGKTDALIEGNPGGDVMECAYARLPGGCGRTDHCKACTIRRTVTATHNDGECRVRVSAIQNIMTPDGIRPMRFLITTEKKGNFVLLQIDGVSPAGTPGISKSA